MLLEQHQHWRPSRQVFTNALSLVAKHWKNIGWLWLGQVAISLLLVFVSVIMPDTTALYDYVVGLFAFLVFAYQLFMAAVIIHLVSDRATRPLSAIMRDSVAARLPALVALSILITAATVVASFFLVVPGVILYVFWILAVYVLVVEQTTVRQALQRSTNLVRGWWWPVLHRSLFLISLFAVQTLIAVVPVVGVLVSAILTFVIFPTSVIYYYLTYKELVDIKQFKHMQAAQISIAGKFLLVCWAFLVFSAYAAISGAELFVRNAVGRML